MAISNLIHKVAAKINDQSFYNNFKKIDDRINNGDNECNFEKCRNIFKSIKDLNENIDSLTEDLLKRSSLVNELISKLSDKIKTIENTDLKQVLLDRLEEITYKNFSLLPMEAISYFGNFLKSEEAAKLLSMSRQIRDGLLSNQQVERDLFVKRSQHIIRNIAPFKSGIVYISSQSCKVTLLGDSDFIKKILNTDLSLFYQFDSIVFIQKKERKELISVMKRLYKNKDELNCKLIKIKNKINSINITADYIRSNLFKQNRMIRNDELAKRDISKLSELILKQNKKNEKFIECAKKIELLEDDISLIEMRVADSDKTDMLEELSFLANNIKKHSRLKYLAAYKNSSEFETAYARIREMDLAIKIKEHADTPDYPKDTLDRAAFAFARNDQGSGMEEFNKLDFELQCLVYYYLYENRCQDRFPQEPPPETSRLEFGKEAFLGLNGMRASYTERLRAVEMARDHITMEKEILSLHASSPHKENLMNTLKAILIRDDQTAETCFEKLDPDTRNLVYQRVWANTFSKRVLITPELQDLMAQDLIYGQNAFHNAYSYPFGIMEKARALEDALYRT